MHGIFFCIYGCVSFDLKRTRSHDVVLSTQVSVRVSERAGLLYSQAKAPLGLPSASELAHRIINALAMHGGQRFASQAGETAGGPQPLSHPYLVLGSDPQCREVQSSYQGSAAYLAASQLSILECVHRSAAEAAAQAGSGNAGQPGHFR